MITAISRSNWRRRERIGSKSIMKASAGAAARKAATAKRSPSRAAASPTLASWESNHRIRVRNTFWRKTRTELDHETFGVRSSNIFDAHLGYFHTGLRRQRRKHQRHASLQ